MSQNIWNLSFSQRSSWLILGAILESLWFSRSIHQDCQICLVNSEVTISITILWQLIWHLNPYKLEFIATYFIHTEDLPAIGLDGTAFSIVLKKYIYILYNWLSLPCRYTFGKPVEGTVELYAQVSNCYDYKIGGTITPFMKTNSKKCIIHQIGHKQVRYFI